MAIGVIISVTRTREEPSRTFIVVMLLVMNLETFTGGCHEHNHRCAYSGVPWSFAPVAAQRLLGILSERRTWLCRVGPSIAEGQWLCSSPIEILASKGD
jgi:hypothetical protein